MVDEIETKVLHIEFDGIDADNLIKWKRKCSGKYGQGGIKLRAKKLISDDLEKLEAEKDE